MILTKQQRLLLVATGTLTLATAGCGRWQDQAKSVSDRWNGHDSGSRGGGGGGGSDAPTGPTTLDLTGFDLTLNTYGSCDELQKDVHDQLQLRRDNDKAQQAYWQSQWDSTRGSISADKAMASPSVDADSMSDGANEGGSEAGTPVEESITNVQEKGVDEADFAKLGTDHFYVLHGDKLEVMDRLSLASLGQLDLAGLSGATLYAEANRLTLIAKEGSAGASTTLVRVYTATKGQMPVVVNERRYADPYADSRFVAGKVILLFNSTLPFLPGVGGGTVMYPGRAYDLQGVVSPEAPVPDAPVVVADGKAGGIACTAISKPYIKDNDFRLTKIVTIDTRDPAQADHEAAVFGGGDQVYMTTSGLYLAKQGPQWQPWAPPMTGPAAQDYYGKQNSLYETLVVTRVAFDATTGAVGASAVGAVSGRVKDQWAFKEYAEQGALAVATTTWAKVKPETTTDGQHNQLWILKQESKSLALKAAINDFGPHEDIRAARYLGSMAYIVTFEKTDPLFAFDLSDPLQPKLLSELKIPGFSMYLHPMSDGRMIGVGYEADDQGDFSWFQGIQVSLFDISNPLQTTRIDNQIIGDRGSYSDVTGDSKAFYEDRQHHLIGVPVVEKVKGEGASAGGSEQGERVAFTGAIVYNLEGDKLEEKARLSHADLIAPACQTQGDYHWWQDARRSLDINRLYTIDGRLITVSRFGVKAHNLDQPGEILVTTKFGSAATDCATREGGWDY